MGNKWRKKGVPERTFEGFYFGRKHERDHPDYICGESVRTDELDQATSCWRKVFYGSEAKAVQAIKDHKNSDVLEAYPCLYCQGWHIGHMRKNKKKRKQTNGGS